MTAGEYIAFMGLGFTFVGAVATAFIYANNWGNRIGKIELKVDTMWDFQMKRNGADVINHDLGRLNSPLVLSGIAKGYAESLRNDLHGFVKNKGKALNDNDLALELQRCFGDRILREICLPNHISYGASLLIAVETAKEILK